MFALETGSYHHLEETFLKDLEVARAADPWSSLLVLSPSGHQLSRLQFEYAKRHRGLLNTHFLSFYALAERLMADSGYTEPIITEPAFFSEMIHQVLTGPAPEPVDLSIREALGIKGGTISRGLAGALAATLKDLRDSGVRAEDAIRAAQQGFLGPEMPEAVPTLALYARLVGLLEKRGLRTSADLLRRASQRAPIHPWIQQQKAIFLYGFYDVTGAQLDLVTSLSNHPNVRLYFPYLERRAAYAYAERLLKDPALLGKSRVHAQEASDERESAVSVVSVSGTHDEVWWTAKEILRLTDEGIPVHEIAVIARTLTPYLPHARDLFASHQIPYSASRGEGAGAHPLIKTIRALIMREESQAAETARREELERSPYVNRNALQSRPSRADSDVPATWAEHSAWARREIDAVIQWPKHASVEENDLFDQVIANLETLTILDALAQPVTYEHFLKTWDEKADRLERPSAMQAPNGVQLLEVQQARGLRFRYTFLLGMNEKVFPRLIREDPFLSDAARSALAQTIGCRLGRKLDGYDEERLLFALMRQTPSDRLYLLTQRSDDEGKARIPSVYLRELDAATPPVDAQRLPRALASKIETQVPMIWTPKELSYLVNRVHGDPIGAYTALGWNVQEFTRLLGSLRAIEAFGPGLANHDAQIENPGPKNRILDRGFSPSSLEEIAECPFQFYASHILKITPPDDLAPKGEITDAALGQLFHRTLELFYSECLPTAEMPTDSQRNAGLELAINRCFEEYAEQLRIVYPIAIKACKQFIYKHLSTFLKADFEEADATGFRPKWFEQSMSGVILEMEGIAVKFQGKADRIDARTMEGQTEVRVVDYKSGKPRAYGSKVETQLIQGKLLQLPIYLGLAGPFASGALGRPVISSEAAFRPLRQLEDIDSVPRELRTSFWKSASAPLFIQNIRTLIEIIEKGAFFIEPDTGPWGYCKRCDFARVCRKEHMPARFRSEHDPMRIKTRERLERTAPKEPTSADDADSSTAEAPKKRARKAKS